MTFQELRESWDDLKEESKRKKIVGVLNALVDYVEDVGEEEIDELIEALAEHVEMIEQNDGFGTEGMDL